MWEDPPAYTDYSGKITLQPVDGVGEVAGRIEYPELECGGTLTYKGTGTGGRVRLLETITWGQGNCVDGGTVTLTPSGRNTLKFRWAKSGDSTVGGGRLTRR